MRREGAPHRGNRLAIGQVEIGDEDMGCSRTDAFDFGGAESLACAPDRKRALQRLPLLVTIADEDDDGIRAPARTLDCLLSPIEEA
jgi:hypothetical protein